MRTRRGDGVTRDVDRSRARSAPQKNINEDLTQLEKVENLALQREEQKNKLKIENEKKKRRRHIAWRARRAPRRAPRRGCRSRWSGPRR